MAGRPATPGRRTAPGLHADPGLQPERTTLAWSRTLLALVVCGALFLRWVPRHGAFPLILSALTAILALVIVAGQARRYRRSARGISSGRTSADVAAVVGTSAAVVLTAAAALLVVVALPVR